MTKERKGSKRWKPRAEGSSHVTDRLDWRGTVYETANMRTKVHKGVSYVDKEATECNPLERDGVHSPMQNICYQPCSFPIVDQ